MLEKSAFVKYDYNTKQKMGMHDYGGSGVVTRTPQPNGQVSAWFLAAGLNPLDRHCTVLGRACLASGVFNPRPFESRIERYIGLITHRELRI